MNRNYMMNFKIQTKCNRDPKQVEIQEKDKDKNPQRK